MRGKLAPWRVRPPARRRWPVNGPVRAHREPCLIRCSPLRPGVGLHDFCRKVHLDTVRYGCDFVTPRSTNLPAGAKLISLDGEHHQTLLATHHVSFEYHSQQALVIQSGRPRQRNIEPRAANQGCFRPESQPHTAHVLGLSDTLNRLAVVGQKGFKTQFRVERKSQSAPAFVAVYAVSGSWQVIYSLYRTYRLFR